MGQFDPTSLFLGPGITETAFQPIDETPEQASQRRLRELTEQLGAGQAPTPLPLPKLPGKGQQIAGGLVDALSALAAGRAPRGGIKQTDVGGGFQRRKQERDQINRLNVSQANKSDADNRRAKLGLEIENERATGKNLRADRLRAEGKQATADEFDRQFGISDLNDAQRTAQDLGVFDESIADDIDALRAASSKEEKRRNAVKEAPSADVANEFKANMAELGQFITGDPSRGIPSVQAMLESGAMTTEMVRLRKEFALEFGGMTEKQKMDFIRIWNTRVEPILKKFDPGVPVEGPDTIGSGVGGAASGILDFAGQNPSTLLPLVPGILGSTPGVRDLAGAASRNPTVGLPAAAAGLLSGTRLTPRQRNEE